MALYCMLIVFLVLITNQVSASDNISTRKNSSLTEGTQNGHEWVDLGLPTGLKWATCNVGANTPEEYGDYFAWGEVEKKETYSWNTYKWCNGSKESLTKYCTVDNKTVLDKEDDAAAVNWSGGWRMPIDAEMAELFAECTWTWVTQNGVKGYQVKGSNGNSIFLPAASFYFTSGYLNHYKNIYGFYWLSSLDTEEPSSAYILLHSGSNASQDNRLRFCGLSIRAVYPCYEFSIVDYLGEVYETQNFFAGEIVEEPADPIKDVNTTEYDFVGWSEEEVELGSQTYTPVSFPYTMPDHKVTLYPVYKLGDLYTTSISTDTEGPEDGTVGGIGVFSVSATKLVSFSPGNLQRNIQTEQWMFASEQYEMLGVSNVTGGSVTTDGGGQGKENKTGTALADKIDLFGWSSDNSNPKNHFGVSVADIESYFDGNFLEWGQNVIGNYARNTWRTLTYDEWEYMRYHRDNANGLVAIARIDLAGVKNANGDAYVNGLILLPDNWEKVKPSDVIVKPGFHSNAHEDNFANWQTPKVYSIEEWKKLEAAGAVFLPAGGMRLHTEANISPRPVTGIFNTRYTGHYWTAKPRDYGDAGVFEFNASAAGLGPKKRWGGRSVRLAHDTLPIQVDHSTTKVTSTAGQTISKAVRITLLNYFKSATTITGYSDNPAFTVTQLVDVGPGEYDLIVNYNPTESSDGIETATITLCSSTLEGKTSFKMTGRHLPAQFAVISKMAGRWYAVASDPTNAGAAAQLVAVNNADAPTYVKLAAQNVAWSLKSSKQTDKSPFVLTNSEEHCLGASNSSSSVQVQTLYNNYTSQSAPNYNEWSPATEDLQDYLLTNNGKSEGLHISLQKLFGTNAESSSVRLVPIIQNCTLDLEVVEWYPTKVLLHTKDTELAKTATIYIDKEKCAITATVVAKNLIEISGLNLLANAGKLLTISYEKNGTSYGNIVTIPVILTQKDAKISTGSATTLDKDIYQAVDLVVRDNATLTIDGADDASNTFYNIYIHPTAKISVAQDKTLTANSVTFWGGIDEIYNGSTYEINKYGVPELSLKGNLNKAVDKMDYIMRVNLNQMYQMGVPYDVALSDITYWDNSAIALGDALYVSTYNGQARANLEKKTWLWEVEFTEKKLKAGVGYTISAEPQYSGDTYSILRMPMKSNIASGATEVDKKVNVYAYANTNGVSISDNHKGWNYISNPYMAAISGVEADNKLVLGYLKETGTGPWEWVIDQIRYVTIPFDNGTDYYQMKYSDAVLKPFKSYFVQIAEEGELSFALSSRQNAPARYLEVQEQEMELELLLSNEQYTDNMGLLIAEQYTPAYEINADLEKMTGSMSVYTIYGGHKLAYNALSPNNAAEWIPVGYIVPVTGEYTFTFDEKTVPDNIMHIYLQDKEVNKVTDLMVESYSFTSSAKSSETRFAINVVLTKESYGTNPEDEKKHTSHKFIYNGQLYIWCNGYTYDANGKVVMLSADNCSIY